MIRDLTDKKELAIARLGKELSRYIQGTKVGMSWLWNKPHMLALVAGGQ